MSYRYGALYEMQTQIQVLPVQVLPMQVLQELCMKCRYRALHVPFSMLSRFGMDEVQIMCKIESWQGFQNFKGILEVADAVVLARGKLGLDVEPERMVRVQKTICSVGRGGQGGDAARRWLRVWVGGGRSFPTEIKTFEGKSAFHFDLVYPA